MKYGRSLQELAIELDRQAKVKKDYVATAGAMQMTAVNENFDLVIGNTPFQLNENAHRQLGLQLKIPAPYYERMRAENPGLLMANVNGWFQQSPDTRRMVRTLDGTARAILSDRYRRIDNYEVAQTVLPIISEMQGARIESCELTDTRMYIKVVNERIQTEVVPGDIVQAGILISNSEVGMGSVSVKPLIYRLVCTNGMVADVGVGKRHVGRINESVDGDFGIFRDETIEADDRAFLMKIEDTVSRRRLPRWLSLRPRSSISARTRARAFWGILSQAVTFPSMVWQTPSHGTRRTCRAMIAVLNWKPPATRSSPCSPRC